MVLLPLLALMLVAPAMAKATAITVPMYETQFQWRAWWGPIGSWLYFQPSYLTSSDYSLTGNTLHTEIFYNPAVTNLVGGSTVYVFDKDAGFWIENEGEVSYNYEPRYGTYTVTNYFRGYIEFNGAPSETSFMHGVLYQWVYIFAPETDTGVVGLLPYAQWDSAVGAWLIGLSVYIWDNTLQTYVVTDLPFPTTMIEPIPASNYNPLGL